MTIPKTLSCPFYPLVYYSNNNQKYVLQNFSRVLYSKPHVRAIGRLETLLPALIDNDLILQVGVMFI